MPIRTTKFNQVPSFSYLPRVKLADQDAEVKPVNQDQPDHLDHQAEMDVMVKMGPLVLLVGSCCEKNWKFSVVETKYPISPMLQKELFRYKDLPLPVSVLSEISALTRSSFKPFHL